MLSGINKETREKIYSFNDLEYIKNISKNKLIICEKCGSILILKAGAVKIHHFAHKNKCTYKYGEPESEEHIMGKFNMYIKLIKLYPNSKVELEYHIKETNQIADVIVIHKNGEKWAFEIQCSRITVGTLIERSLLYKKADIIDTWFLGYEYSFSGKCQLIESENNINERINKIIFNKFNKNIEIKENNKSYKKYELKNIIFKKYNNYLIIKHIVEYKESFKLYNEAIKSFYNHFKKLCLNSDVLINHKLKNINGKTDLLIISKNTNDIIVINFIFPYLNNHNIDIELNEYKKKNITIFWIFGIVSNIRSNLPHKKVCNIINLYKFNYGYILNGELLLKNIIIGRNKNSNKFYLKDVNENIIFNKDIIKKIKWNKLDKKWSGIVYKCPLSTLEEHDLRIESIINCEKCKYFNGYIKEGIKKKSVLCRNNY